VTAIEFMDSPLSNGSIYLAVGTEIGQIKIYSVDPVSFSATELQITYSRSVSCLPLSSLSLILSTNSSKALILSPQNPSPN
jgi:hypothetical protein